MSFSTRLFGSAMWFLACCGFALGGEAVTVQGKIEKIDVTDRRIVISPRGKDEKIELELTRKTTIKRDGKEDVGLDTIKPGDNAKIKYDSELLVAATIELGEDASAEEVSLFNGNDFEGWKFVVAPFFKEELTILDCWGVDAEKGVLFAKGKGPTWLASEQTYDNFNLNLEWRFVPNAPLSLNGSGIVIRAAGIHSFNADPRGIEIDIAEKDSGHFLCYGTPLVTATNKATGEGQRRLERFSEPALKRVGEWNTIEIHCDGDRITVKINGKKVNEGTGARVKKGEVCLRSQNSAIEFRNVRLTPIKPEK